MRGFLASRFLTATAGFSVAVLAGLPMVTAEAAPPAAAGRSAEHARIVEHWTPARRAAAIPRDFVLDEAGNAFLKLPHGGLELYGRSTGGDAQPMARPGGGTGGAGPTNIGGMDPSSGSTIGASHTFKATVSDPDGLRSVTFSVRKGTARAQNFSASLTDAASNVWTTTLSGFSDGTDWSWQVIAKDGAGITTSGAWTGFTVSVGSGGGGGGDGSITNAPWDTPGILQTAAGRIYFEMPSNSRKTRWAGYVCSGTVVTDGASGRSIILTAAHCVYDDANKAFARNVLFIPNQDATSGAGTDRNCDNDPLGCWTPNFGVVDQNWTTRTFPDNKAWDYAFYVVSDSGRQTGATASSSALDIAAQSVGISFNAPTLNQFTYALGYSYSDDPLFMYCAANMTTEGTVNWWVPGCGLSGGSSGGPWMQDTNLPSTGTGTAMSVNSWGYTTSPGMAGPKLNGTSASRLFCRAKNEVFGSVPTTDGNAGVTVGAGTATCP